MKTCSYLENDKEIKCAPMLIPTLCRYDHFFRCVESLKKNSWAKYTDVYIALDYPKNESHFTGYEKICKYLKEDFSEFKSFNVIKRTENYGSGKNSKELIDYVFESNDKIIRTDDDCEFSENFLEYINKCLLYYENDDNVIGVTGYSYPLEWCVDNNANVCKSNFICPMWGTAFYREKYIELEKKIEGGYLRDFFNTYLLDNKKKFLTDARFLDYINGALTFNKKTLIDCMSDVSIGIYLSLNDVTIIMPKISKVRNHGFDGSGVYCQNFKYTKPHLDPSKRIIDSESFFEITPSYQNNYTQNRNLLNNFDARSNRKILKAKFKILIYKILGKSKYEKILGFKKIYRKDKV